MGPEKVVGQLEKGIRRLTDCQQRDIRNQPNSDSPGIFPLFPTFTDTSSFEAGGCVYDTFKGSGLGGRSGPLTNSCLGAVINQRIL